MTTPKCSTFTRSQGTCPLCETCRCGHWRDDHEDQHGPCQACTVDPDPNSEG